MTDERDAKARERELFARLIRQRNLPIAPDPSPTREEDRDERR